MRISRRSFATRMGAGAAGLQLAVNRAEGQDAGAGQKLRYCIVGLGRISLQHFMPACKMSQYAQVTAFVSGHRDKAEKYAAEYGVPAKNIYDYTNFDEIAKNGEIDAVYIALPNSMHAEYTIRAAKAGKHVLCEKPMATSVEDCKKMIEACRSANRKLMIAYRCQYEPTNLHAVQLIREGKLGKIQLIESTYGFNEKMGEWRLDRKLAGGGPLMDVGIYSLNACRYLTGEEPEKLQGYSSVIDKDGRFDTVEENLSFTMRFPSGIVASVSTTYGARMSGFFRVYGSAGILNVEPAFSYDGLHLKAQISDQPAIDEPNTEKDPAQFVREADHFARCVFDNKEPRSNGEEGLRDMRYMAEIYRSCGLTMGS